MPIKGHPTESMIQFGSMKCPLRWHWIDPDWEKYELRALPRSEGSELMVPMVLMDQFDSLDEFKLRSNNFWERFDASCGMAFFSTQELPCFRRLIALYPELYLDVLLRISRLRWSGSSPDSHDIFDDRDFPWEALYGVYQKISRLVSDRDPHVLKKNGEVDGNYLCH